MKTARIRKKAEKKVESYNEEYSIKSMAKIIIIISIIFCLFYFITTLIIKPSELNKNGNEVSLNENQIIISQLLSRKDDEYYVLAHKNSLYKNSGYMEVYNLYINKYLQEENALPFYYVDLDSALNKEYFGKEINITDDISKLKLNDEVLFRIKDGKIEKTYQGKDKIIDKLSRL